MAKRSLVSITNGSPGWTRRTGGCVALKLVQSWSLVTRFMTVAPFLGGLLGVLAVRRSVARPPEDVNGTLALSKR